MTQAKTSDVRLLFRDAVGVIFKRKKLILAFFLIVALGISFAVLSIPSSYEVTGKLVVTRSRGDMLVTPADPKNFNFMITAPSIQDMAVHAELLKNRSLLEAVAQKLSLERKADAGTLGPASADATPVAEAKAEANAEANAEAGTPIAASLMPKPRPVQNRIDSMVDSLAAGLTVAVVPNSNLILVKYRSSDPVKGAQILNVLLDLYLDQYLRLHKRPGVAEFFTEQRDRIKEKLQSSETGLKAFQRRAGLLSATVQVDSFSRRLAEGHNNFIDAKHDQRVAEESVEAIKARLVGMPERVQRITTNKLNPMIQTLKQNLLTLEMQRRQLLALYTENDRRVIDIGVQIEALKKELAEAPQYVPDIQQTELNQSRRDLEDKLFDAKLLVNKNRIRVQNAVEMMVHMKDQLAEMGLAEVERESLLREIQASSEGYLLYRKKVEEARITEAMDDNKIMNVAIGEKAARQGVPVGPPKNLSLVFAVMVGLVSGLGAAFLREFFDGSIKTEHEVRAAVDLPVLGSIPEEKHGKNGKTGNGKNGNGTNGH